MLKIYLIARKFIIYKSTRYVIGLIYLEALDKHDNVNYRCIMTDAYPLQLGAVSFGYENADVMKFNAQFRYR